MKNTKRNQTAPATTTAPVTAPVSSMAAAVLAMPAQPLAVPATKAKAVPLQLKHASVRAVYAARKLAETPPGKCAQCWQWAQARVAAGLPVGVALYQQAYPQANPSNTAIELGYWHTWANDNGTLHTWQKGSNAAALPTASAETATA